MAVTTSSSSSGRLDGAIRRGIRRLAKGAGLACWLAIKISCCLFVSFLVYDLVRVVRTLYT